MKRGMQSVQNIMADSFGVERKKKTYTQESNEQAAVRMSKKFIAFLANEDFFDAPIAERMTETQAKTMDQSLKMFVGKNPIMRTAVGSLCTRHIYAFINNLMEMQSRGNHKFSKFDIIAMLPAFMGASNHE